MFPHAMQSFYIHVFGAAAAVCSVTSSATMDFLSTKDEKTVIYHLQYIYLQQLIQAINV